MKLTTDKQTIIKISAFIFPVVVIPVAGFLLFSYFQAQVENKVSSDPETIEWEIYTSNPKCGNTIEEMKIKKFTLEYPNIYEPRDCTELPKNENQEISTTYVTFYDRVNHDRDLFLDNIYRSVGFLTINTGEVSITQESYYDLAADLDRISNSYLEQYDESEQINDELYLWKDQELLRRDFHSTHNNHQYIIRTLMIPKFNTDQGFFVYISRQVLDDEEKETAWKEVDEGYQKRMLESLNLDTN